MYYWALELLQWYLCTKLRDWLGRTETLLGRCFVSILDEKFGLDSNLIQFSVDRYKDRKQNNTDKHIQTEKRGSHNSLIVQLFNVVLFYNGLWSCSLIIILFFLLDLSISQFPRSRVGLYRWCHADIISLLFHLPPGSRTNYCDEYVCFMSVRSRRPNSKTTQPNLTKFLRLFSRAVARSSSNDGVAILDVLPVFTMTSCFHITALWRVVCIPT